MPGTQIASYWRRGKMLISIFFIIKTILYLNFTQIEFNRIPVFLITTTITMLILSLINLSKSKHKDTFKMIFYSTLSVIMFVDVIYYTQFAALPSVVMLSQTKQLAAVTDSIKHLLEIKNLLLILDIPVLIFISRYMKRKDINIEIPRISKQQKTHITLGILILTLGYLGITDQVQSVTAQELYSFHALDIIESLSGESQVETGSILTEEDITELENRRDIPEGKLTGIGKDKNLIVIQIESLQEFALDLEYNNQIVTPNLDKLINDKSSIYYDEYYQLIGRGNTSDTEFVSHNSVYPSMGEPSYVEYEENTFYGLPWLLRDNGYTAWSMHGYEKEFWNREKAYVNQGFQRFVSEEDYKFDEVIGFGLRDEDFFQQSIEYIKELDKVDDNPFYAFLITLTSHAPYKMDEKYQHLELKEEDEDTLLGNYLQSIHYTDKHLGEFIENLKEEGLYDDSVIVMYGDHFAIGNTQEPVKTRMTEFLGEEYDFDSMTNIPLIITIPGEDIKATNSKIGSPLDFYPTMANIMGYENTKGLIFGRDLNNFKGQNFIAPQTFMLKGSFIDKDTLFVMSRDGIFEHSRATSMKTGKDMEVEQFRDQYERSISEINKSEFILKNDLLKPYIENEGRIDLQMFKDKDIEIKNKDLIKVGNYKTTEELQKDYEAGYRLLAVNIGWDDGEIVVKEDESHMTLLELMDWIEDKKDAYIVLRTEEDRGIFDKVKVEYKNEEIMGRFIPEISSFDDYMPVTYRSFGNAILNLKHTDYSERDIMDFLKRHTAFGVTVSQEQVESGLAKEIRSIGVNPYIENISNKRELKRLKKAGVFGGFLK